MLAVRNINRPRSYPRNPSRNGVASCVIIPRKEEKKIVSFRSTLVHACNSFLPARGIDYFPFSRFEPLIVDALVPCGSSKVGSSRTASSIHRSGSINCSRDERIFLSAPRSDECVRKIRNFLLSFVDANLSMLAITLFNYLNK